ncbi:hypothetical protein VTI74DRAFT_5172 [Chaetomium olivicolor]
MGRTATVESLLPTGHRPNVKLKTPPLPPAASTMGWTAVGQASAVEQEGETAEEAIRELWDKYQKPQHSLSIKIEFTNHHEEDALADRNVNYLLHAPCEECVIVDGWRKLESAITFLNSIDIWREDTKAVWNDLKDDTRAEVKEWAPNTKDYLEGDR